jgi:hypothetical protein
MRPISVLGLGCAFVALSAIGLLVIGCSSDCAPMSGGVLVNVTGVTSCDTVTVSASDGSNNYSLEATGTSPSDGGLVCEFQGLNGHPGAFTVQVFVQGQLAASQPTTLQKLDECNVTAELVTFDLSST